MVTGCTRGYPSKSGNAPTRSVPGIGEEEFPDGTYPRALTVPYPSSPRWPHGASTRGFTKREGGRSNPLPQKEISGDLSSLPIDPC